VSSGSRTLRVALLPVNQVKNRIQAVSLLDRALSAMSDDELTTLYTSLPDDHRTAIDRLVGGRDADADSDTAPIEALRNAAVRGRMNGTLEQIATVLTDACLADCIERLGDHADNPTEEQLMEVAPGVVEQYGLGTFRLTMASSIAGEAAASAMLSHVLRHHETMGLPPVDRPSIPLLPQAEASDAVKAKRREAKAAKQAESAARRLQAARARNRA
jgi:hypothetical protein